MNGRGRVLIVDDELIVRDSLGRWFQEEGYEVGLAEDSSRALTRLAEGRWDVALVDIKMPGTDGIELQSRMRLIDPDLIVIIMTGYASVETAVQALKNGAYDYVTKPFDPDELSARVAAILRRVQGTQPVADQVLDYGNVVIDLSNRRVVVDDEEVQLSKTEWEVLYELATHPGRVMLHGELLARIWGPEFRDETYYLRTWVSRIRKKLGDRADGQPLITTFPGVGYRLDPPS